jgi:hypothetical protein
MPVRVRLSGLPRAARTALRADPASSYRVGLVAAGYRLAPSADLFYGQRSNGQLTMGVQSLTGHAARAAAATVPPYSITTLTLNRA